QHAGTKEFRDLWSHRSESNEVIDGQGRFRELSDGDAGAHERDGRDNDVHAAAIGEAGIADGARLVDMATERRDDAVDDAPHVFVVVKAHVAEDDLALLLDV